MDNFMQLVVLTVDKHIKFFSDQHELLINAQILLAIFVDEHVHNVGPFVIIVVAIFLDVLLEIVN